MLHASGSCRCTVLVSLARQIGMVRLPGIICSHSSEHMNYKPGRGLSCCRIGKGEDATIPRRCVFVLVVALNYRTDNFSILKG